MEAVGSILILAALVFVLVLAVAAIVHGRKGMKLSKTFEDKKAQWGYWAAAAVHLWAGILIVLCYVISIILVIISYKNIVGG